MPFADCLLALLLEVPRQLLEHVLEHRVKRMMEAVAEDAALLGFLLRRADLLVELGVHRLVPLIGPFAERDQVRLEARDRIAERPFLALLRAAVDARIVRGRM